jgi:hypothetical protein
MMSPAFGRQFAVEQECVRTLQLLGLVPAGLLERALLLERLERLRGRRRVVDERGFWVVGPVVVVVLGQQAAPV